eukprot:TRINITY_DN2960_c0_g1_i2.p1 TRINITY_DN2960_c0_g1~~TRINITY_DN2960_c0_g1_i2.p1  ORF type:complete len:529 (-),score=165.83 TRINITY_DN2960_c0_g1_i2:37-1623(-)
MSGKGKGKADPKAPDANMKLWHSVIDGLKALYKGKILPLEQTYKFGEFHSPYLLDSDIEAKPMVLLLGQYSTGKTTFIRYLLERDFPGQNIGPEPTTDRFNAVMWGPEDRIVPGNTVAVQEDKPFRGLSKFGTGFLGKFQCSQCPTPILEKITFIDTPGVLSGEKQRIGRSYDFPAIIEWFAERADMILLLFDAHKLDISDEFKTAIDALKGHDDKVRVVLNKADKVSAQQLLRVYGALMWSLGKVMRNPEVVRVYLGSFWENPPQNEETSKLLEAEMNDLITDLKALPKNAAVRKLNELVKRARLAKVHAYLIAHLKNEMPALFGKESRQQELIDRISDEYVKVQRNHRLPPGDFPEINRFRDNLKLYEFHKFPKLQPKMIDTLDEVLGVDFPALMQQFPVDREVLTPMEQNPFMADVVRSTDDPNWWTYWENVDTVKYASLFANMPQMAEKISGQDVKGYFVETGLPMGSLAHIWKLSDMDKDGKLDRDEFMVMMHLVELQRDRSMDPPPALPPTLVPPSKRNLPR